MIKFLPRFPGAACADGAIKRRLNLFFQTVQQIPENFVPPAIHLISVTVVQSLRNSNLFGCAKPAGFPSHPCYVSELPVSFEGEITVFRFKYCVHYFPADGGRYVILR